MSPPNKRGQAWFDDPAWQSQAAEIWPSLDRLKWILHSPGARRILQKMNGLEIAGGYVRDPFWYALVLVLEWEDRVADVVAFIGVLEQLESRAPSRLYHVGRD